MWEADLQFWSQTGCSAGSVTSPWFTLFKWTDSNCFYHLKSRSKSLIIINVSALLLQLMFVWWVTECPWSSSAVVTESHDQRLWVLGCLKPFIIRHEQTLHSIIGQLFWSQLETLFKGEENENALIQALSVIPFWFLSSVKVNWTSLGFKQNKTFKHFIWSFLETLKDIFTVAKNQINKSKNNPVKA